MTLCLELRDGSIRELPVASWHGPATAGELALLGELPAPVLDVGCGPGRIAAALSAAGTPSLGIDIAPAAVRCATESGAAALCRSVFDAVPGEGRWGSLVLLDGNVGIGGDPVALLRRCRELGRSGARLVLEVDPPGVPGGTTEARIHTADAEPGPWFPWSVVSVDDLEQLARAAGAELLGVTEGDGRHFAQLEFGGTRRVGPEWGTIAVIAKTPVPGRVKTRLCPPCGPRQAADLATAALQDTLAAACAARAGRRVLVLEGEAGDWVPQGMEVIEQATGGLGDRLQALFETLAVTGSGRGHGAVVVVGMDTPQVMPEQLEGALDVLCNDGTDAVLGRCPDGGYWTIGFDAAVMERGLRPFEGVPMSTGETAEAQLARLGELGLGVALVGQQRDIDHWEDALAVARTHPHLNTSRVVGAIGEQLTGAAGPPEVVALCNRIGDDDR